MTLVVDLTYLALLKGGRRKVELTVCTVFISQLALVIFAVIEMRVKRGLSIVGLHNTGLSLMRISRSRPPGITQHY